MTDNTMARNKQKEDKKEFVIKNIVGAPDHTRTIFDQKRSKTALIIPIINEGERILEQIKRLKSVLEKHNKAPSENMLFDIILADGGSTDGSTSDENMAGSVRALLVKNGPGKQGAQFRMGLAFCLQEGYEQFVTMDGNGKDGVEGVERIIAALDDGVDYVQGSRYAPGGEAINTPFFRKALGRFVHAPTCSLSSGAKLTDTTNGFRGYSARLVTSPEMSLFRDIFSGYEFLFYISCRAARRGMIVREVPVRRAYPDSGKVPTKMSGIRSKARVFEELFKCAMGRYDPTSIEIEESSKITQSIKNKE